MRISGEKPLPRFVLFARSNRTGPARVGDEAVVIGRDFVLRHQPPA